MKLYPVSVTHSYKRVMRQTSLEAYYNLQEQKLLNEKQLQVYGTIIYLGGATNLEISKFLNWPINCVTPRTRELFQAKKIFAEGERLCMDTKRNHTIWKVRE